MGIRKSEFVTGLFILAALLTLAFVGVTPFLKSKGAGRVRVVADFDQVALLKDKAQVAVRGIRVGIVESRRTVVVDGEIVVRVTMEIDADFIEKCCEGTRARIQQESFLGDKFVDLVPSFSGSPLKADDGVYLIEGEPYADWTTMLSSLGQKLGGIDHLIAHADELLVNANTNFLSSENATNFSTILREATDLMDDAKEAMAKLNDSLDGPDGLLTNGRITVKNTADLTGALKDDYPMIRDRLLNTVAKMDKLLDDGNARINRIGEIIEEANPKLQGILKTADDRLPKTLNYLDDALKQLDTTLEGADQLVRNRDLIAAFYDLRVTLQEMSMTLRSLRADPSQIIFGGPGEAQKALPDPRNKLKDRKDGRPSRYGY